MDPVQLPQGFLAAKDYADAVVKGPLSELGGILTDTVGHWRLKNQIRLLLMAKEWLNARGVDPKKVLPDVFVPLLTEGASTSNEALSDMFASLLACHVDPAQEAAIHPSYAKVLAQLSPLDAKLMLEFRRWCSYEGARDIGLRGPSFQVAQIAEAIKASNRPTYLSILNLLRLGIVEHTGFRVPDGHPVPTIFEESMEHQEYRITEYGIAFSDACTAYRSGGAA